MKCTRCGRSAFKSTTSEAFEMPFGLPVIRNIPCWKCDECDDIMFTGDVLEKIERIIAHVRQNIQQLTIIDYTQSAA